MRVIVVTLLGFLLPLDGFTSPFSLFTIGRQIGIATMIGLPGAPGLLSAPWLSAELGLPNAE
jgi:hypothetical protein